MALFEIVNSTPAIKAEALLIPELGAIHKRDKSKDKLKATRDLAYVYYSTDYKSAYLAYTKVVRDERLGIDFMDDPKYVPDQVIAEACKKYDELQQTPTMNFLKAARHALQETENYFMNIDYAERDVKGNAVYKGTDVTKMLKDCAGIKDSIDKLEQAVKKELSNGNIARGGGTGGEFEFDEK